jgi:hypothetical protein
MVTRYQSKVNIPIDIKIKMTERRIREFSYQVPCLYRSQGVRTALF